MEIFRLKETTCKWSWTAPNFNAVFSYASSEISTVKLKFEKVNMFTYWGAFAISPVRSSECVTVSVCGRMWWEGGRPSWPQPHPVRRVASTACASSIRRLTGPHATLPLLHGCESILSNATTSHVNGLPHPPHVLRSKSCPNAGCRSGAETTNMSIKWYSLQRLQAGQHCIYINSNWLYYPVLLILSPRCCNPECLARWSCFWLVLQPWLWPRPILEKEGHAWRSKCHENHAWRKPFLKMLVSISRSPPSTCRHLMWTTEVALLLWRASAISSWPASC